MIDENREGQNRVSRRRFLRIAGAAGLVAASPAWLLPIVRSVGATKLAPADQGADAHRAMAEAAAEDKTRHQWCMVIDLRKCDGCTGLGTPPQCATACIQGHYVPEGQQWIQVFEDKLPGRGTYFMPAPCYQCENSPCVNVCPVAATYQTPENIVLIDHNRCIGCRLCMAACPYQRRFFNWARPKLPPAAYFMQYSPELPVPARMGTVIKCVFCIHLLKVGKLPMCVSSCPRHAMYMGDLELDAATDGQEVVALRKFLDDNNAYRYKENLGTQPRVWYIPGHGQLAGRKADSTVKLLPVTWPWG